jgi:hypothetical protein
MRKTTKLVGSCMVAALVAMFAVLPAAGASASSNVLVLKASGTPVAVGSEGVATFTMNECGIYFVGKVTANSAKTDAVVMSSSGGAECPFADESISGLIKEVSLKAGNSNSKSTVTGSITYTSGECVYAFSKFKMTSVGVPGFASLEGTTKGKLTAGNKKTCPKLTDKFFLSVSNEVFGEAFETELAA